jgi:hypothetical protein
MTAGVAAAASAAVCSAAWHAADAPEGARAALGLSAAVLGAQQAGLTALQDAFAVAAVQPLAAEVHAAITVCGLHAYLY